ncbi:MAG: hypothetical protein HW399_616, partial [Dehalococcoidia bacterium]|nr:hypothetical protein [Dehalococcoidia bacterium]
VDTTVGAGVATGEQEVNKSRKLMEIVANSRDIIIPSSDLC